MGEINPAAGGGGLGRARSPIRRGEGVADALSQGLMEIEPVGQEGEGRGEKGSGRVSRDGGEESP